MTHDHDVIVIGGGPAGATAALSLARDGLRVMLAERETFPRFHVGESLLPENVPLFRELGLEERLARVPRFPKSGVEFAFGHEEAGKIFLFRDALIPGDWEVFNVERAPFDAALLEAAVDAGAVVRQGIGVRSILRLTDGDVAVRLDDGAEASARYLVDASGQGTVVGRHLGIRRRLRDRKKVAFFGHFHGDVDLPPGDHPSIVMMADGWFWIIPLGGGKVSIGLVMHQEDARQAGVPSHEMLAWGIARCPLLAARTARARFPAANGSTGDFSYACRPYAGPGYFLVGDAATFVDPIFSTGVLLGMTSAREAARRIQGILAGSLSPAAARRTYARMVRRSTGCFFRLVRGYYQHRFRELLVHGQGPVRLREALLAILAGRVYPAPPLALRWRLRLFEAFTALQRWIPVVPRRAALPLLPGPPAGAPPPFDPRLEAPRAD